MFSTSEKCFPFSALFEFWKHPEVSWSQVRRADDQWRSCLFLLKTAEIEAENVPGRCQVEESELFFHNSARLRLTASISLFNIT
jgi:hypothetical protein